MNSEPNVTGKNTSEYVPVIIIGTIALIAAIILLMPVINRITIRHTWIETTATILDENKSKDLVRNDTVIGPRYADKYKYHYTYSIDGTDYGGTTDYVVNQYKKDTCSVFIDPNDYSISKTSMETNYIWYLIGAILFLTIGLIEIMYVMRQTFTKS